MINSLSFGKIDAIKLLIVNKMLTINTNLVDSSSNIPAKNISEDENLNKIYKFLDELGEDDLKNRLEDMISEADDIECDEYSKDVKGSGAFGEVVKKRNSVIKLSDLFHQFIRRIRHNGRYDASLVSDIESTLDTCEDMRKHVQSIRKLFPQNFPPVYSCKLCMSSSNKILFESKLKLTKATDFSKVMPMMSKSVLTVVELQLLYIFKTLNHFGIYHNDLAPRNIMISNKTRDVTYNQYPDIILKMKNVPVPIIIDFDFLGVTFMSKGEFYGSENDIDTLIEEFKKKGNQPCARNGYHKRNKKRKRTSRKKQKRKIDKCSNMKNMNNMFKSKEYDNLQDFVNRLTKDKFKVQIYHKCEHTCKKGKRCKNVRGRCGAHDK